MSAQNDGVMQRGLPHNNDAEKFVLGAVLKAPSYYAQATEVLTSDDFNAIKHKRIWRAIQEVAAAGDPVDNVTVATQLKNQDQLQDVGGVSYLVAMDEGLAGVLPLETHLNMLREETAKRRLVTIGNAIIARVLTNQESSADVVKEATNELLGIREAKRPDNKGLQWIGEIFDNWPGGPEALLNPSIMPRGVQTGFPALDRMIPGGLQGGEVWVLAARPSMGKTSLALDITRHVSMDADLPRPVAIFSLEMSAYALLQRMIVAGAKVDSARHKNNILSKPERERLLRSQLRMNTDTARRMIAIDEMSQASLFDIGIKARRIRDGNEGLGLVVIDYLQLMNAADAKLRRPHNRNEEIGIITRGLKLLSKDLGVPILILSQLSRAPEQRPGDHRPQLSDLRDSGTIEQDADGVIFIFRPEMYRHDREDLRGLAIIILAKQRNGPTGEVTLTFVKESACFANRTPDDRAGTN